MSGLAQWVAVAAIGGLAALARFRLDGAVARRTRGDFPWGTMAVNGIGAFLAGLVAGLAPGEGWRIVVAVGALGSFSTFSTWMLETRRLAEDSRPALATANLALGIVAGLALAGAGWALGARL